MIYEGKLNGSGLKIGISVLIILRVLSQHKKRLYKNKRNTINSLKN